MVGVVGDLCGNNHKLDFLTFLFFSNSLPIPELQQEIRSQRQHENSLCYTLQSQKGAPYRQQYEQHNG